MGLDLYYMFRHEIREANGYLSGDDIIDPDIAWDHYSQDPDTWDSYEDADGEGAVWFAWTHDGPWWVPKDRS